MDFARNPCFIFSFLCPYFVFHYQISITNSLNLKANMMMILDDSLLNLVCSNCNLYCTYNSLEESLHQFATWTLNRITWSYYESTEQKQLKHANKTFHYVVMQILNISITLILWFLWFASILLRIYAFSFRNIYWTQRGGTENLFLLLAISHNKSSNNTNTNKSTLNDLRVTKSVIRRKNIVIDG